MNDLIARLMDATGPDRELDALIAVAAGETPTEAFRPCAAIDAGTFGVGSYGLWVAPAYTSSIDAALVLVPEDWGWRVDSTNSAALAKIERGYQLEYGVADFSADGPTPAIALCIAALKARITLATS
jgi:hypothetical protein